MANAPTFKTARSGGGLSLIPIVAGVVLTLAITAYALTRGRPAEPPAAAPRPGEPPVTTIGRPPVAATPAVAEPEPPPPVVTRDLPAEPPPARERRKAAERDPAARPARPAPAREVARAEKAPAPARAVPITPAAPVLAPAPAARAEPEPPAPPPPLAAAPPQAPPSASAPLAIGPSGAREGYQKARQARPGCVVSSLRLPRDIAGVEGESALIKFQVDEAGAVSQFNYLSGPSDQRVSNAIWAAVQRCEWVPGATAQGRPITLWVTMPIKFGK